MFREGKINFFFFFTGSGEEWLLEVWPCKEQEHNNHTQERPHDYKLKGNIRIRQPRTAQLSQVLEDKKMQGKEWQEIKKEYVRSKKGTET